MRANLGADGQRSEIVARLGERAIAITLPRTLLADGILASLANGVPHTAIDERIVVSEAGDRSFALQVGDRRREDGLKRGALLERLLAGLAERFAEMAQAPLLAAAAVSWGDGGVLIAGPKASGKSSLAAWFVEKGFALIADDQVALVDDAGSLAGYPAPFAFAADAAQHLVELGEFSTAPMARTGKRIHVGIKESWRSSADAHPCRMMIFPRYAPDARPRVDKLDVSSVAILLKGLATGSGVAAGDFRHIQMARTIPAVALSYSRYEEIDGLIDRLVRLVIEEELSPGSFERFISGIGRSDTASARKYPVPERSTRQLSRFLTIGMATYDDYDGVYFSLQAMRFYHPEILDEVEFLIVDNHPNGPCGAALKDLEKHVPNLRYVPAADVTGTAVRERVFSEAGGEFVLCMDCHVLFAPGSLRKLIDYFRTVPASNDLIQGPIIYDDLVKISTHWSKGWRQGMFGKWDNDPAGADSDNPPFAIPFQGLGVFACRRQAWPGFNPAFRGFGGEEGYIHEKFRQAGGRTLCLPALRWLHRFGRPMGPTYPNRWEDRIRNYLIGFGEIGWDSADMQAHFREQLGRQKADRIFAAVRKEMAGGGQTPPGNFDDDQPYDLNDARLRFLAATAVPILLKTFDVQSAACIGRGAELWVSEFLHHGVEAAKDALPVGAQSSEEDPSVAAFAGATAPESSADVACCFEIAGISSAPVAEKFVQRLTRKTATVVFAFARPEAASASDLNRLRAFWASLFARRGYKAVDCLRPALAGDPRIDKHYQQNIIVFSKMGQARAGRSVGSAMSKREETGVSVIIPVYNGAAFLGQAIESVLLQTHETFELIVVNDGSTDMSGAIAESYARVDKRVRVIHKENGGEASAFNAATRQAQFALLARLDHDDVALPERLMLQVAFLERNDEIAAVGGALRCIDDKGRLTGGKSSYPLTPEACHKSLRETTVGPIANPTAMIRKAAFEQVGGLREQFRSSGDFDLWLRLDERFKLANLPDIIIDYRLHGQNSTTKARFTQTLNAHIAMQAALLRRRGHPDPIDGWSTIQLDHLAIFPLPEEARSRIFSELFDAALANFAATQDAKYLKLADNCLSMIPA